LLESTQEYKIDRFRQEACRVFEDKKNRYNHLLLREHQAIAQQLFDQTLETILAFCPETAPVVGLIEDGGIYFSFTKNRFEISVEVFYLYDGEDTDDVEAILAARPIEKYKSIFRLVGTKEIIFQALSDFLIDEKLP
jgi:hypothetical protein